MSRVLRHLLLAASLLAACHEPEEVTSIRPQNLFYVQNAFWMDILGRGLGAAPGQVWIGDELLGAAAAWAPGRIRVTPRWNGPGGRLRIVRADGVEVRGPMVYPVNANAGAPRDPLDEAYDAYVDRYARDNGLENDPDWPGWAEWMKSGPDVDGFSPRSRYRIAFQKHKLEATPGHGKVVTVAYSYHQGHPYPGLEPWPSAIDRDQVPDAQWNAIQELLHMLFLKRYLQAAFPSWTFWFVFEGASAQADILVKANHPSRREFTLENGVPTIYVTADSVLAHEMGHYLSSGTWHHFRGQNPAGQPEGQTMPPGPAQACFLDHGSGWCNACLAGFGIPRDSFDPVVYRGMLAELAPRYDPDADDPRGRLAYRRR